MEQSWNNILRGGYVEPTFPKNTDLPRAVAEALDAVAAHLLVSPAVRAYLEALPKGPGTNCPDSDVGELVRYIAITKGQIDKSDPYLNVRFLRTFVSPMFEFEREEVRRALARCADASEFEQRLVSIATRLGTLHDELYLKWFTQVAAPYQALDAKGQARYVEKAKEVLAPQFDYTVHNYDPGQGFGLRLPMAVAFKEEIDRIASLLFDASILCLNAGHAELGAYFDTLRNAYSCTDFGEVEKAWTAVDQAWVRIPQTDRLLPVHGMESGYDHPFGVMPEFRLEVRTKYLEDEIELRRRGSLEHAQAIGLSDALIGEARGRLSRTDVAVFYAAIRAGSAINFRYAGQAVPNRMEVQAVGSRIFVDKAANKRMTEIYKEAYVQHVAPSSTSLVELITPLAMQEHTLFHEFAHPQGRTMASDQAMGGSLMKCLEEGKASLMGVGAEEWRVKGDPAVRLELVVLTVVRLFRMFNKNVLENPTMAPYVRENRAAAFTLFETGVIRTSEQGLEIDVERAKSAAWFEALHTFYTDVINAYQSHDVSRLQELTEHYADEAHGPTVWLIEWVNRKM